MHAMTCVPIAGLVCRHRGPIFVVYVRSVDTKTQYSYMTLDIISDQSNKRRSQIRPIRDDHSSEKARPDKERPVRSFVDHGLDQGYKLHVDNITLASRYRR